MADDFLLYTNQIKKGSGHQALDTQTIFFYKSVVQASPISYNRDEATFFYI